MNKFNIVQHFTRIRLNDTLNVLLPNENKTETISLDRRKNISKKIRFVKINTKWIIVNLCEHTENGLLRDPV